jgi:hypothetical protein
LLARSYAETIKGGRYWIGEASSRTAHHLVIDAASAVEDLSAINLWAMPHPNTTTPAGVNLVHATAAYRSLRATAEKAKGPPA